MEIKEQSRKDYGFQDLTVQELWQLTKYFCVSAFVCLLIFGLPWAFFTGVGFGAKSVLSESQYSWLETIFKWALGGLIGYLFLANLSDFLKQFGEFFVSLGEAVEGMSVVKRVVGVVFIIAYFYLLRPYPTVAGFSLIVILLPAAYTYEHYKALLKNKSGTKTETA